MEATLEAALVDEDGDPLPDTMPAWLEVQRVRLGRPEKGWPRYLAHRLKVHVRTAERWLAGSKKPEPAVCRALRLALASPMEAEVMRCLIGALRAAQAASIDPGGGGERRRPMPPSNPARKPVSGAADSPTSPPPPSPAALAAALARRRKPDGQ